MYLWFFHYPPPAPQRTCCFHSFHLRVESSQETTVSLLCLCLSTSICLSLIMSCYFDIHFPSAFTASILGVDSTWDMSRKKNIFYCLCACMFMFICICFCRGCTVYQHDTTLMSNAYDASTASIVGVKTSWETTSRQPTAGEARGGRLFSESTIRFPLRSKDLEAFCIILSYRSYMKCLFLSLLIKIVQIKTSFWNSPFVLFEDFRY